jgi:hypothetical protein
MPVDYCNWWEGELPKRCTESGSRVKEGFCDKHRFVEADKTPPAKGVQQTSKKLWTKQLAQQEYPSHKVDKEYLVGGANKMHVHLYPGAAHVKVGEDALVFLTPPDRTFDAAKWNVAVTEVRKLDKENCKKLLEAMVWSVAQYGNLTPQALSQVIENLQSS